MKVAVYISLLNRIGGVETFTVNLCNRMGFDLIFDKADFSVLKKLKYNAYQLDYLNKEYDIVVIASSWNGSPQRIKAKKYIQTIHADYEVFGKIHDFHYSKFGVTTHHVAVSKYVASQFEKVTGYKVDKVIYNLLGSSEITNYSKNEKLSFITLSRFSKEKGFERMLKMAEMMKNVDYEWNIYGDISTGYAKSIMRSASKYSQLKFRGVTERSVEEISKHSYLVQLSDTEGFCYSIYEALSSHVPVIATDFPSIHELLENGKNGYILKMDLSDFDNKTINKIPVIKDFKEKSSEQDWFNFLNEIL